jgi:hypothetical protein
MMRFDYRRKVTIGLRPLAKAECALVSSLLRDFFLLGCVMNQGQPMVLSGLRLCGFHRARLTVSHNRECAEPTASTMRPARTLAGHLGQWIFQIWCARRKVAEWSSTKSTIRSWVKPFLRTRRIRVGTGPESQPRWKRSLRPQRDGRPGTACNAFYAKASRTMGKWNGNGSEGTTQKFWSA